MCVPAEPQWPLALACSPALHGYPLSEPARGLTLPGPGAQGAASCLPAYGHLSSGSWASLSEFTPVCLPHSVPPRVGTPAGDGVRGLSPGRAASQALLGSADCLIRPACTERKDPTAQPGERKPNADTQPHIPEVTSVGDVCGSGHFHLLQGPDPRRRRPGGGCVGRRRLGQKHRVPRPGR